MASEDNRRELEEKVTALVATRFGGDYRAAFDHFDANSDGVIDNDELKALLKEAGIGSGLTRWAWAKGVMDEADTDTSGTISWAEFETLRGEG
jgi:Ca2+-binding EF-hand superfamily protein